MRLNGITRIYNVNIYIYKILVNVSFSANTNLFIILFVSKLRSISLLIFVMVKFHVPFVV
jgi:hypothetical protein